MYYIFLIVVFNLTAICFAFLRAAMVKSSVDIFDELNVLVAACVTFLFYYHKV